MRLAKPEELKTHAYPVMTAAISEAELSKWFPVTFQDVTDPQEVAEPSKAALVQLAAGSYLVILYGKLSNQLMLRIPTSVDPSFFMTAFFREVPLPRGRIVWRRQDAKLPRSVAAKTLTAPLNPPRARKSSVSTRSTASRTAKRK